MAMLNTQRRLTDPALTCTRRLFPYCRFFRFLGCGCPPRWPSRRGLPPSRPLRASRWPLFSFPLNLREKLNNRLRTSNSSWDLRYGNEQIWCRKLLQWKQLASRVYSAGSPALTGVSGGSRQRACRSTAARTHDRESEDLKRVIELRSSVIMLDVLRTQYSASDQGLGITLGSVSLYRCALL